MFAAIHGPFRRWAGLLCVPPSARSNLTRLANSHKATQASAAPHLPGLAGGGPGLGNHTGVVFLAHSNDKKPSAASVALVAWIDTDPVDLLPQARWTYIPHVMIRPGREVCSARKPDYNSCIVAGMCPSAGSFG